jgi:hypothetical protein
MSMRALDQKRVQNSKLYGQGFWYGNWDAGGGFGSCQRIQRFWTVSKVLPKYASTVKPEPINGEISPNNQEIAI